MSCDICTNEWPSNITHHGVVGVNIQAYLTIRGILHLRSQNRVIGRGSVHSRQSKKMSRRGGRGAGRGGTGIGSKTIAISREKGSSTYAVRDKTTRSMSELSSLTDVSTSDLAGMDVLMESSVLKVKWRQLYTVELMHSIL